VHGTSHEGMVWSGVWSLVLHVLIRVMHRILGWARSVFACVRVCCLLCRFVLRLFMCSFFQHDSRWRHVSFWRDVHELHVGDMSCLKMCSFTVVP
jgi:hypothetical protein